MHSFGIKIPTFAFVKNFFRPLWIGVQGPLRMAKQDPPKWDPTGLAKPDASGFAEKQDAFELGPLRISKKQDPPNRDPSGLAKNDPSGLAKQVSSGLGLLRFGKNGTPPDWQKHDPSGLAKRGHLWIGKSMTLPDWQKRDHSGLAKI